MIDENFEKLVPAQNDIFEDVNIFGKKYQLKNKRFLYEDLFFSVEV